MAGKHIALAAAVFGVAAAAAAPPRITSIIPDNGQADVDPALTEIRVEFNQDMNTSGYSWVGGGPTFPKAAGKPAWASPRVCVLPVQLEPERTYQFGINSSSARGFRSVTGEPVEPYSVSFRTRGRDAIPQKLTPDDARRAATALRSAIDDRYSYRDLTGIDWASRFGEHDAALLRADSPDGFVRAAVKLLEPAKDPHLWFVVNGLIIPTATRDTQPNYSVDLLAKIVPGWQRRNEVVATGRYADGIGYLLIESWLAEHEAKLAVVPDIVREFADTRGLVIDVRPNNGGSETLAQRVASCFVGKPRVFAKHVTRDPAAPGGFSAVHARTIEPAPGGLLYTGRVAVLMGPRNMSSAESFLLMMKQAANGKLIGARSCGSSGNPQPIKLTEAITVYVPSWKAMTADGELLEGRGIAPDIEVASKPDGLRDRDPVLEAALSWLHE